MNLALDPTATRLNEVEARWHKIFWHIRYMLNWYYVCTSRMEAKTHLAIIQVHLLI
ncbi:MAG: hypothetical protein SFY66_20570 [Oculatellaceae cyanobacterium bins.114]|nr:hypothetical protein [Oculatellaceae cyanobacterium bins.114]